MKDIKLLMKLVGGEPYVSLTDIIILLYEIKDAGGTIAGLIPELNRIKGELSGK